MLLSLILRLIKELIKINIIIMLLKSNFLKT